MKMQPHSVYGDLPVPVYEKVVGIENEWLRSETCTTVRLYAKQICRLASRSTYSGGNSYQGDCNLHRLLQVMRDYDGKPDYRQNGSGEDNLSAVLGHDFKLVDPKTDVPFGVIERKSHYLCGWKIRAWENRQDNHWSPTIRMITHQLWVDGGRECYRKVKEFLSSSECKVAVQMAKVQSILNDAAPEQPRMIRAKIGRGKTVPAFKVQTP